MWKVALKSVLHQAFCPYGLMIAAAINIFMVVGMFHGTAKTASYILTGTPYFPIQIGVGAINGYLVGRYTVWPLTRWIWIVPVGILLAYMIFDPLPQGVSLFGYWFGWSGVIGHVFPSLQTGVTGPFYLSAAYSLFSLLGERGLNQRNREVGVESQG